MSKMRRTEHYVMECPICNRLATVGTTERKALPNNQQSTKYFLACGCTVEVVSPVTVEANPEPKLDALPIVPCPACGGQARESVRRDATIPVNGLPWTRHKLDCGHTVDVRAV